MRFIRRYLQFRTVTAHLPLCNRTNTSTSDIPPSQSGNDLQNDRKDTNVGAIVGGVIGGVALLVMCVIAGLLYRRHRIHSGRLAKAITPDPFMTPSHLPASSKAQPLEKELSDTVLCDPVPSLPNASLLGENLSDDDNSTAIADESLTPLHRLQFFRAKLEALRSRAPEMPSKHEAASSPQDDANTPSGGRTEASHPISPLADEIAMLRSEASQLRYQQANINGPVSLRSPDADHMQREIAFLRGEIEELRMQQLGPLPEYTPPPDAPSRPLPTAPGQSH